MLEQRLEDFEETERRAQSYLQDPTAIPSAPLLTGYNLRFRFWHFPAFESCKSWSVFELRHRREPPAHIVRQVTWDRLHDHKRLRSDPPLGLQEGFHGNPKIELRDRPLDTSELDGRLAAARPLSIPIVGRHGGICVDGAMFGYHEGSGSPRLEWCCSGPDEWRGFTTWARGMMSWLDQICSA